MTTTKHEFVDDYPFLVYTDDVNTTKGDYLVSDSNVSALTEAPEGTISITENGSNIDVAQYAHADVNVSGGGGDTEYDITYYEDNNGEFSNIEPFAYEAEWGYDEQFEMYRWVPKNDTPLTKAKAGTGIVCSYDTSYIYPTIEDYQGNTRELPYINSFFTMPSFDICVIKEIF